jgi:putative glycosyltransferase (TIGR04372 family)
MFFINQIISFIFFKIGYFLITPKIYSFGGFYQSLIYGLKFCEFKKKKHLIVIGLINLHEKNFLNIYNLNILLKIFYNYTIVEKFFCIFLSMILNINLLLLLILRKLKIWYFFSDFIKYIFCDYIGYANHHNHFEQYDNKDFFLKKIKFNLKDIICKKIDLSNLYKDFYSHNKNVTFCIKDINYEKIKKISTSYSSDVAKCKKSLDFILSKNFMVSKVGDPSMKEFNYIKKNYFNYCNNKKHQFYLNNSFANCEFYFGSSASHGIIPELFNKKKIIINQVDHIALTFSTDVRNFLLFKKVYSCKTNNLMKLEELFKKKFMSFEDLSVAESNNEIKLVENTEEEILDSLIEFYEFNFKGKKIDNSLNKKYFELRREYLTKNNQFINTEYFDKLTCTISNKYLINNL